MGAFYYFGYASNMNEATLEGRLQSPPKKIGLGVLQHFGFRFNHPNPDGSSRANIVPSVNESVYGVLYEIQDNDLDYFLKSEPGYDFELMEVHTKKGKFEARVFISQIIEENIFPNAEYWKLVIQGGKKASIPKTYLAQMINRAGPIASF